MKKLTKLLTSLIIACVFKYSIAGTPLPAPAIIQQNMVDNYGFKWILMITLINGVFPTDKMIIDGICTQYNFTSTPQRNLIDLTTNKIASGPATMNNQGQVSTSLMQNIPIHAYTIPDFGSLIIETDPTVPMGQSGVVSFHIVYQ